MAKKIGQKRTAIQVQADRQVIAQLYLRGQTQQQIAQYLSGDRPYTLTQQQISFDLAAIRKGWQEATQRHFDALVAEQLARIDEIERAAWEAFEQSKHRSWNFLDQVRKAVAERSRLLGLNAPEKIDWRGKLEAYGIDPDEAENALTDVLYHKMCEAGDDFGGPARATELEPTPPA